MNSIIPVGDKGHIEIRPLTTDELPPETLEAFLAVNSCFAVSKPHVPRLGIFFP
jgi:hypothetical protein